ncbi:MAG TPA: FliM/FliN family flagellar motor switch protein [Candidatus Acidoferrum sp.]|nr:FliM/FliN family flagellar motor switch protein [Candidatus Acidoferrum sp.]
MSTASTAEISAFVEVWKAAFVKVLAQMGAPEMKAAEADGEALQPKGETQEGILSVKFSGGGCLKGEMLWTCEKTAAVQCAQLLMSEAVDSSVEFGAMHTDGYLEFMRQVAGEAAMAWKQERGEPTEIVYQAETGAKFETHSAATIRLTGEKCKELKFRVDMNGNLAESLAVKPQLEESSAEGAEGEAGAVGGGGLSGLPSNLDLILDVQLDATIRFGEREMLLQDVFGLMPGSVVELNQLVSEPAELLVAGRLVAKGEVVVVDGNFGLRVTEVVSRNQRAAMLEIA